MNSDKNQIISTLTDEQISKLAEEIALKLLHIFQKDFYHSIGKSLFQKLLLVITLIIVSAAAYMFGKGIIKL